MSTDSIVNIVFISIFALCSIFMIGSTIWFIYQKKKIDKEFWKEFDNIMKEFSKDKQSD